MSRPIGVLMLVLFLSACGGGGGRGLGHMPSPPDTGQPVAPPTQPDDQPPPADPPADQPPDQPPPAPAEPVTLEGTGSATKGTEPHTDITVQPPQTAYLNIFDEWGFWGKQGEATVFKVYLDGEWPLVRATIEGMPTGSNPTMGSATWLGDVRGSGYGARPPVTGDARIEMDLAAATVDVDFTNLTGGQGTVTSMSWSNLSVVNGSFSDSSGTFLEPNDIEGAFYGDAHQAVAGKFERDDIKGVFGALRE